MIKSPVLFPYFKGLLGILLLTSCSSFTHTKFQQPEIIIPANWQSLTVSKQVKLDPWWQTFKDPELNILIEQVLLTNNDLTLATLTLKSARLKAGLTAAEGSFQLSSSNDAERESSLNSSSNTNTFSSSLNISYEVDLWGRVDSDIDMARWNSFATNEDRESTAQSLASTTASLYWQIGYLKQSLALSQDNIDYAQQSLDLIQSKYRSGAVTKLDIFESQRNLAEQQVNHSELEQELVVTQNALAILYNQPPLKMPMLITKLPDGVIPSIAVGIPSDLLIRRPDVKSALYSLKAAYASKDATFAGYLPTLTLSGALGSSSDELKNLLSNPIGTLGANLVLPFLQWNEMQLNKAIANIEVESAVVSYRQTLYTAFSEVDNAISARQHYQYQAMRLQEQYNAAKSAEEIYASQYKYGAVSIQDWLDAKETLRTTEQAQLQNRYNQFSIQATLYQALGGSDIAPSISIED